MPAALDLQGDVVSLLAQLIDIESVSGNEKVIADRVEEALRPYGHLEVMRDGNVVVARTDLGRSDRIVVAGHLDTVPLADNIPSRRTGVGKDALIWGRGACDMKAGVAVALSVAAALAEPNRDVTWIFYDNEEVEAERNGLGRLSRERPDLLAGSFAVLGEPSNAGIEGGCQGTMRVEITLRGLAAHSARAWKGRNAIHAATPILQILNDYRPAEVEVEGLRYREGLNAVGISGGIAGNVIPDRCTVAVNYRFAPDKDPAAAEDHIRSVFHDVARGGDVELTVTDVSAGARPGLDRPAAAEFLAAVGGTPQPKFGWTDVALFSSLGVPAVNFGPGDPSKAHADDEFCPAADVIACRDAFLRWLA